MWELRVSSVCLPSVPVQEGEHSVIVAGLALFCVVYFFSPKMVLLQKHLKYFVPVLRAVDMLQGTVGVVALSASVVGRT